MTAKTPEILSQPTKQNPESEDSLEEQESHFDDSEQRTMRLIQSQFAGPVPPPEVLNEYGRINSSFPERIIKMAEKEQDHRHRYEEERLQAFKKESENDHKLSTRSMALAFSFAITCLLLSAYFAYLGIGIGAVICLLTTMGSVVYAFITKQKTANKDLEEEPQE